jgi:hypothetical protein
MMKKRVYSTGPGTEIACYLSREMGISMAEMARRRFKNESLGLTIIKYLFKLTQN